MDPQVTTSLSKYLEAQVHQQQELAGDYHHWRLRRDGENVLWLYFDKQDSSANTVDAEVLQELSAILHSLEEDLPRGLVIQSLKRGGFCAGADIKQFFEIDDGATEDMLRQGHELLDRLESFPAATVAVVHGHCLGGGLELALACKYRIGVNDSLQMGFPEIQLGLHPGLGGTFRLTGLIDPLTAMTMMLTGRSVHGRQCLQRGLVNQFMEERHVQQAVRSLLEKRARRSRQSLKGRLLNTGPLRNIAARRMQVEAAKKAPPQHYPAPNALIGLWREHGGSRKDMQRAEIESFARLLGTDTCENLVRVFFLQQSLKEQAQVTNDIHHVHVIGAGTMGGDIAAWCALSGCQVTLSDARPEAIGQAVRNAYKLCRKRHKSAPETRQILDRLVPDPDSRGLSRADLVIEAVPEDLELKARIYRSFESQLKSEAILATNTSSIPLEKLAEKLENPERLVGIHFFNPVAQMLIVEVVNHEKADEDVVRRAESFVNGIRKLPVRVSDYPGFLVNRALTPYLMEAIVLADEGVEKEQVDQVALDFGMPMGPLELADQVGLDICLHVGEVLRESLDKPFPDIPDWLQEKVDAGSLGRKSGEGLYQWKNGKAQKTQRGSGQSNPSRAEIADRLILPLLNACVECYREGVVSDLDHLDAAMIFATGFAPFTGGPMRYARSRGIESITARLTELEEKHGERFRPDPGWQDI